MVFDAAPWLGRIALLLMTLLTALGGGCSPDALFSTDEDRERNFQRARDAERLGDYEGAAEYYERAIEKNPRAPSVHLGYASLCEGSLRRHADAVYHYQRYLRLRPDDPKADDIRRRITNCMERLATSVPLVIRSETIARDLASVRGENLTLRSQVTNLMARMTYWSNEWQRATLLAQQAAASDPGEPGGEESGRPMNFPTTEVDARSTRSVGGTSAGTRAQVASRSTPARPRTHRVAAGETMDRIARTYGVPLSALQRANPQVQPRRMPAGSYLRIPEGR